MSPDDVWVVVPAYNEGERVVAVIDGLLALYPHVVVVDDGSQDGSAERVLATRATLLRHACNLGQGAALQTGISYALSQGAKVVVTFDADGQHQVSDIGRLVAALHESQADVVLGSRFLGAEPQHMPAGRRMLLRAAVLFTRAIGGVRVTDTHNGLRVLTAEAAAKLHITQNRMAHASEILHKLVKLKLKFVEVPITVHYSASTLRKGQSALDAVNIVFELLVRRLLD